METTNRAPFWYEELALALHKVRNAGDRDYLYHFRDRAKGFIHALYAADVINEMQYHLLNAACLNAQTYAQKDLNRASI